MLKKVTLVFMLAITLLSGCKTTRSTSDDPTAGSDQDKPRPKAETAKINAQLGIAYLEQRNVQRAKLKLLLALQQGPDMPETWYSMAYFLEATGNEDEARKYYLKSVAIDPKRGDSQNNYGTFLCRNGKYDESIKHFMLAANSPEYLDPAAAYENAGLCSMKNKAYQQAVGYFNQALLKDPARTISLLKTAEVNVKLGNYKAAKSMMTQYLLVASPTDESENLQQIIAKHLG